MSSSDDLNRANERRDGEGQPAEPELPPPPADSGAESIENLSIDSSGHPDSQKESELRENRPMTRGKKALLVTGLLALTLGVGIVATPFVWLHYNPLPDIRLLETYRPIEAIQIYDKNNRIAAVVASSEDRQVVPLSQISPSMRKAMMAAEDHDFYKHGGINPSSIVRAMMVNLQAGRVVEGGSTITQQLVKNLFFPGEERSYNRKIKEFFLANQVDQKYSKNQILEMYLNQIYFGNQAYGVERAAQRYFSKPASKLNLAESAFIAGLVKAPSYLSNPANRAAAIERQQEVLDKLAEYKLATQKEVDQAKAQKLAFRKFVSPFQKYPFYISYVMDLLHQKYGSQELQRGLKVYTNLDPTAQLQAEKVLDDGIKHAPPGITQGALVSVHVDDGSVFALVGGVGPFEKHQWNRAVSPHTMGSCFKPFVYLTGFLKGLTPDSIVRDEPITVPSGGHAYTPKNFDSTFMGPMPVRKALALSRNVCAIRIALFDGITNVINTARLAGITSRLDPYIPIAVGACAASPLEMAGAYSTFARGGVEVQPRVLRKVTTPGGEVLANYTPQPHKVFDSNAVALLTDAMQTVVKNGTAILAQLPGRPVAGKTGTSDHARDIWFIGFTPDTCTAVWGGNDHEHNVAGRSVTGGMIMAVIWKKYMLSYYKTHPTPVAYFPPPAKQKIQIAAVDDPASAARARSSGITIGTAANSADNSKNSDTSKKANKAGKSTLATAAIDSKDAKARVQARHKLIAKRESTRVPEDSVVELRQAAEPHPVMPAADQAEVVEMPAVAPPIIINLPARTGRHRHNSQVITPEALPPAQLQAPFKDIPESNDDNDQ